MTQSTSDEQRFPILQMGAAVYQHLAPGERGVVLAALPDVAYLRTALGEILWLSSDGTPMHRRCARVGKSLPRLEAGAPFNVDRRGLNIGPRVFLESATALLWQPCPINAGEVVPLADLPGRIRALASILDCAQAPGLGQLIPPIVHGGPGAVTTTDDPVLRRAKPLVLDAADAFRKGDGEQAVRCADALVGLGAGLTPSGDDFLGGLLFGASALCTGYPGSRFVDVEIPVETYRARTHPISFTLLGDHASGHAIAPLHGIVNGILTSASMESIRPAVLQLVHVGHSTGWDTLAGLFAGLLIADNGSGLCS
jgi:Protein of unknown function (DUF2877)